MQGVSVARWWGAARSGTVDVMERAWPVAITAIGSASTATVAWRHGTQLFVTAVVKGTFALVPNGPMVPIAPEPIFTEEQEGGPGLGLYATDDLAPHLGETDVSLTGCAPAPRSSAITTVRVRLSILRDGRAVLEKALELEVPRGGAPRPIPIRGIGPISKQWPVRRRLLGAVDPRHLDGPILEIPRSFDWRYFQASSSDMRLGALRGDEWIRLEGMHPTLEQFTTQLPSARGVARLSSRSRNQETVGPVALTLDSLRIDADRRRCSITWRGRFAVSSELSSLHIDAGIELPGRPLLWPEPTRAAEGSTAPRAALEAPEEEDLLGGTIVMADPANSSVEPPAEEDLLGGTIIMAERSRPGSEEGNDPLAGTLALPDDKAAALAARPTTPFRAARPPLPSSTSTPAQTAFAPKAEHDPLGSTLGLDENTSAAIAKRPAIPFQKSETKSTPSVTAPIAQPEEDPLAGTIGLGEGVSADLARQPAMPFRTDLSSPPSIAFTLAHRERAASHEDPLGNTLDLEELPAAATARPATPFQHGKKTSLTYSATIPGAVEAAPGGGASGLVEYNAAALDPRAARLSQRDLTPTPASGSEGLFTRNEVEMPRGLGAQFLVAMAALDQG